LLGAGGSLRERLSGRVQSPGSFAQRLGVVLMGGLVNWWIGD
jgi:hypothetical protein